ncbi:hypothetical protein HYX11_03130 [Candidatus Woesearchaeota archaeon]|nr:hypothetical protein [Candidatus Woesearchaeota archaeon]
MVDPQKATLELNSAKQQLLEIYSKLKQYDTSRITNLTEYLKNQSSSPLQRFQEQTLNSIPLIDKFETTFLQILAYVFLLKDEGHRHPYFQELLARYHLANEKMLQLKKIRKQQYKHSISLTNLPSNKLIYRYHSWRLRKSIYKEHQFWLTIQAAYFQETKQLSDLRAILKTEAQKEQAVLAAASTAWLVPIVGTALFFSITTFYEWANQYSENYKRLITIITQNGS